MATFLGTWQKLIYNGVLLHTSGKDKRLIALTNFLLLTSFSAYIIFDILLYQNKIIALPHFILLTVIMLFAFFTAFVLMSLKKVLTAKFCLLAAIFLAIFFYDNYIGKGFGIALYYFPFFLSTLYIFTWEKEKNYLIGLLFLPVVLIFISGNLKGILIDILPAKENNIFYNYNFILSFLLMAANAVAVIIEHNHFLKRDENIKLDLQSLIDNTKGYIWSINKEYELIAYNSAFSGFVLEAYEEKCFEGFDVKKILNKPNSARTFPFIYKKVLGGETISEEYFSNGNYFEMQASPLLNNEGKFVGATFHSQIITAKKIAEQNLIQSKINLETLVDSIGNSTWSLTKDYKIIVASKLYREDMKRIFNADITPGFDISTLFKLPNYPAEWRRQYDTIFSGQNIFEDYSFGDNHFELTAVPIKYINKEVSGAVFFSRDITARKRAEQELNQSRIKAEEATLAKAQFLSNMSHELRTPLNGIIGLTHILLNENYLPSQADHLETLKYSGDHMLVLINDILDFNKIEAGKIVLENNAFSISDTIKKMHTFFSWEAEKKQIIFNVNVDERLERPVYGDITRLRQVLTNLISNAIKFTDTGAVTVDATIIKKTATNKSLIRFRIADTGIGIAENKLSRIFESFSQADPSTIRKYGGSGLGLTISKKILELMDAQLFVESIAGKGSIFWFEKIFESAENTNEDITAITEPSKKDLNNIHILVVEDNPINMMVATKTLQKWNVRITRATDGQQAIALVMLHHYDVILMDLQMPVMDGITATKNIRMQKIETPVIALTATVDENLLVNLIEIGMNEIVQKPFSPDDLFEKIRMVIKKNSTAL